MGERAGAAAPRRRRPARRLRALQAPPRGRRVARPAGRHLSRRQRAASGAALARLLPRTDVFHFYFGLTLVPQSLQFPLLRAAAQEVRLALPRLGHPRQDARRSSRTGKKAGRPDRRQLRRDPLGAGGGGDPAGDRPRRDRARAAVRPRAAADRPRAVVAPAQGHRARGRGLRGPRRRPRARRGPPPRRGVRALPRRRHRRRPAERRLVRRLRDRGDGARQAGRHLPARRGGPAHARRRSASRVPIVSATTETLRERAPPARRATPRAAASSAPPRAPTSSRCTTSSGSPTACSTSTLVSR